jgi:hypothetical protein
MIAVGEGGGGSAPDPIVMKRKSNVVHALIDLGEEGSRLGRFLQNSLAQKGECERV